MISATIITLNEEKNISKVLESLRLVADEVVIVDSGSKDKTLEIAGNLGAKLYFREFDNFANQKNWAVSKATGDWILSVDADEEIPRDLAQEIKRVTQTSIYDGYLISRRNFILGAEIKHSRWSPDKHIWLWKKEKGKWVGEVHEEVIVKGKVGELTNRKNHYQDETVASFLNSNNKYSSLLSESLFKRETSFSLLSLIWDPIFEFLLRFVYKLGFLDGWRGFILSYLMAIYKLIVWVKIYELQNLKKKK